MKRFTAMLLVVMFVLGVTGTAFAGGYTHNVAVSKVYQSNVVKSNSCSSNVVISHVSVSSCPSDPCEVRRKLYEKIRSQIDQLCDRSDIPPAICELIHKKLGKHLRRDICEE